jgi:hypothetical protein
MTINLTKTQIDAALPKVAKGLQQYVWLQAKRDASDLRSDSPFRRQLNHFYRVRRKKEWQDTFYELLENFKGAAVGFADVFDALYRATGRYEASFASKLLASLNPDMPVIDSIVLGNLKLRLPAANSKNRVSRIYQLHAKFLTCFTDYLAMEDGKYLVTRFREIYPGIDVAEIKMLDFVLWQTRAKKPLPGSSCTTYVVNSYY